MQRVAGCACPRKRNRQLSERLSWAPSPNAADDARHWSVWQVHELSDDDPIDPLFIGMPHCALYELV
jgi:hypothetical protein